MKTLLIKILSGLLCLAVLACANAERDNQYDPEADNYTYSDINITPSEGTTITGHEAITIQFGDEMDPLSIQMSGTIDGDPGAINVAWSETVYPNDTLTLTPSGDIWEKGADMGLSVECDAVIGDFRLKRTVELGYEVEYVVYVSITKGVDNVSGGTRVSPCRTVQYGINQANTLFGNPSVVRVAKGTYSSDYYNDGNIPHLPVADMIEGISLYGGYNPDSWSMRDTTNFETIIEDTSTSGGSLGSPNRGVYIGPGITNSTVIDGFTIIMGKGNGDGANTSIYCNQGSPTITNNLIQGRAQADSAYFSIGIKNGGISGTPTNPVIFSNTIDPGGSVDGSPHYSCGIYNTYSSATIENNIIYGGTGYTTIGINNSFMSTPTIENNIIYGGYWSNDGYCIKIYESSPKIENNNLNVTLTSLNTTYAIYEQDENSDPSTVRNNNFNYVGNWFYDEGSIQITTDLDMEISTLESGPHTLRYWGNISLYDP